MRVKEALTYCYPRLKMYFPQNLPQLNRVFKVRSEYNPPLVKSQAALKLSNEYCG